MSCTGLGSACPGGNLRGLQRERVRSVQHSLLRFAERQILVVERRRLRSIQRALAMDGRKVMSVL